jgi:hypothetical protein
MNIFSRALVAFIVPGLISTPVLAHTFQEDVRDFRVAVDSGAETSDDAVKAFATALAADHVTLGQIQSFMKARMTASEYAALSERIQEATSGIAESELKPEEVSAIASEVLGATSSSGLAWGSCETHIAIEGGIAAAVGVGVYFLVRGIQIRRGFLDAFNARVAEIHAQYDPLIATAQGSIEIEGITDERDNVIMQAYHDYNVQDGPYQQDEGLEIALIGIASFYGVMDAFSIHNACSS